MAFAITSTVGKQFSFGDGVRTELIMVSAISGDTSATFTAPSLANVYHVVMPPAFLQTAAPTFAGNQVTLHFTVPTAGAVGSALLIGV